MRGEIIVELKSDTCIGTGDSTAGIVDAEVQYDAYGIPYIPARRVKGILREEVIGLCSLINMKYDAVDTLFGTPGNDDSGAIWIGNGYIRNYEDIVSGIEQKRNELGIISNDTKQLLSTDSIYEIFTNIRVQTAINKNGVAEEDTLRMIRTINKGLFYRFPASINIPVDIANGEATQLVNVFKDAVKCIRHIGTNRNRGYGWVSCRWEDITDSIIVSGNNEQINCKNNEVLKYRIKLLSDCILDKPYISGSTVRGMVAAEYLRRFNLKRNEAQNDGMFCDVFISDKVIFTDAYPSENDKTALPLPLCFSFIKGKRNRIFNRYEPEHIDDNQQYERADFEFCILNTDEEPELTPIKQETITYFHHKRSSDVSIGNAADDGGEFFSYDATASETEFTGKITGPDKYISIIKELIIGKEVFIGKSRSAQYGHCLIVEDTEIRDGITTIGEFDYNNEEVWPLLLLTDMLLYNENGCSTCSVDTLVAEIRDKTGVSGIKIDYDRTFIGTTYTEGFNMAWKMPKPVQKCLAKGSLIALDVSDIDMKKDDFYKVLNDTTYGQGSSIGLGCVQVIPISDIESFEIKETYKAPSYSINNTNEFQRHWEELLQKKAYLAIRDIIMAQSVSGEYFPPITEFLSKKSTSKSIIRFLQIDMLRDSDVKKYEDMLKIVAKYAKRERSDKKDNDKPYKTLQSKILGKESDNEDNVMNAVRSWLSEESTTSPAIKHWVKELNICDNTDELFNVYKVIMTQLCVKILWERRGEE